MRTFLMALALGSLCLVCNANSSLAATQHGQIPTSMLSDMGLSAMQPMSDAQGMQIRAKGNGGNYGGNSSIYSPSSSTTTTTGSITVTISQSSTINFENAKGTGAGTGGGLVGGALVILSPVNAVSLNLSTSLGSSSHHHR